MTIAGKSPADGLQEIERALEDLMRSEDTLENFKAGLAEILQTLGEVRNSVRALEIKLHRASSESLRSETVGRELNRTTKPLTPPNEKGPHHVDWKG